MPEIFRTDAPNVMHETIDDEVVIVNMGSGAYFSLVDSGARIWSLLGNAGMTLEQLVDALAMRYAADRSVLSAAAATFIEQLREEELIRVVDGDVPPAPRPDEMVVNRSFEPPVLNKYTDMETLLLVDPIHEVSDEGWPDLKQKPRDDQRPG